MKRAPASRSLPVAPRRIALFVAAALSGPALAASALPTAAFPVGIPITFERNDGQYPVDVLFVSRGLRGTLALRSGELAVTPRSDAAAPLRIRLGGANPAPEVVPGPALRTQSHHYVGASRIEHVPNYGELAVKDVYPGIDMVLHGRDGALEYDLVVAPRADPRDIRLDLRGADSVALDSEGNLRLARAGETLTQHAPIAYKGDGAQRRNVDARFEVIDGVEGPEARIVVGAYDPAERLTIDPVIAYSTYVGGSGADGGTMLRVDATGEVFYTLGASGSADAITVTRLDPATNTLVYQTTFGGHGYHAANGIALAGETAYVVGTTNATDFPVLPLKGNASMDAFVAVIAPSGTLANTRLIGGSASDSGTAITLDGSGNVYVAGYTQGNLPVTTGGPVNNGAIITPNPAFPMVGDGFVGKLDPTTLSSVYLRYVGGSGDDYLNAIAVDSAGSAIVGGRSLFGNFPQRNVGSPVSPPPPPPSTFTSRAVAAKLSADGSSYVYAEYIGGSASSVDAVAYDASTGDAVMGGSIFGNLLVPASSSQPYGGATDGWIARVDGAGNTTWSSYIGGSATDSVGGIAVDSVGTIFVTGQTFSGNFPVVDPLPGMGTAPLRSNAYVARFTAGTMDFASFLGGSGDDSGRSLAVGSDGALWVGGFTNSTDFPTVNPYRATRSGPSDGFIARISWSTLNVGPPGGPPGLGGNGPPGLGGNLPPGLGGNKPNGK